MPPALAAPLVAGSAFLGAALDSAGAAFTAAVKRSTLDARGIQSCGLRGAQSPPRNHPQRAPAAPTRPLDGDQGPSRNIAAPDEYGLLNLNWDGYERTAILEQLKQI